MSFFDIFKGKCELCKKCSNKINKESTYHDFTFENGTKQSWFFSTTKKGVMEEMIRHLQNQLMNCIDICKGCRENFARENKETLTYIYNLNEPYLNERKAEIEEYQKMEKEIDERANAAWREIEREITEDVEKTWDDETWGKIVEDARLIEATKKREKEAAEEARKASEEAARKSEEAEEAARVFQNFANKEYQEDIHRQQAIGNGGKGKIPKADPWDKLQLAIVRDQVEKDLRGESDIDTMAYYVMDVANGKMSYKQLGSVNVLTQKQKAHIWREAQNINPDIKRQ